MIASSLLIRRMAGMAILAAALCSSGCQTTEDENPEDSLHSSDRALVFPQPKFTSAGGKGKWTEVPRAGGAEYIQVLGDMEDVISFYGFSHPVDPTIKTFDDVEALMRADSSLGFQNLQRGEIAGVPVLWFQKEATDKGAGSEELAAKLGARPRRADGTYIVRTRGVFMLQPGKNPRFVTIACARTSPHGEIGPVIEGQFQAWLTSIVETCFL